MGYILGAFLIAAAIDSARYVPPPKAEGPFDHHVVTYDCRPAPEYGVDGARVCYDDAESDPGKK